MCIIRVKIWYSIKKKKHTARGMISIYWQKGFPHSYVEQSLEIVKIPFCLFLLKLKIFTLASFSFSVADINWTGEYRAFILQTFIKTKLIQDHVLMYTYLERQAEHSLYFICSGVSLGKHFHHKEHFCLPDQFMSAPKKKLNNLAL